MRACRLKVCYLANPRSAHSLKWLRHFIKEGYEVSLLTFEDILIEGASVFRLPGRAEAKASYAFAVSLARSYLRRLNPDILHSHYAAGYGTLGVLTGFHPHVLSVWGSDVFEFPKRSPLHRALLRFDLSRADVLCSTSRAMREEVRKYTGRPVRITPFGVDCSEFCPKDPESSTAFVVGTVRNLEPHYGIQHLLPAFALLKERYSQRPLRLRIVGSGSSAESLQRLARELGIEGETDFVGAVAPDQIPELLRGISVFVAPSLRESFGVAVLEAAACGLPVVASNVGGLPEVLIDGETGILVPPADSRALAEALHSLAVDEDRRQRMGRLGREFVLTHYEWSENASRMERLYEEVAPSREFRAPRSSSAPEAAR